MKITTLKAKFSSMSADETTYDGSVISKKMASMDDTPRKGVVVSEPTGTMWSSWTVMAKTMIGVAMLGLASAVSACGWFIGFILLITAGFAALFTLHLLNRLSMSVDARHVSFYVIADRVVPWARWIVDMAIAVKCFGVGTAYLQVGGTQFVSFLNRVAPSTATDIDPVLFRAIIVFSVAILLSPFCFRKRLNKTAIINALGIVGLAYVVILGIVYCDPGEAGSTSLWPTASAMKIISKLPVFIFTFTCHQNMFLVAEDLADRSQKKLDTIAVLAEFAGICLFLPVLICPYLTYGNTVNSNFVDNMDISEIPVQVGKLILGVAEVCAFPLQLYPCRKSIMVMLTKGEGPSTVHKEKWWRRIITFSILTCAAIVATFVKDLGITLRFVGIVGSNTICYIMPTFLYCATFPNHRKGGSTRLEKIIWWSSAVLCLISVTLLPLCLGAIISTDILGAGSSTSPINNLEEEGI